MPILSARLPAAVRAAMRPLMTQHTYTRTVVAATPVLDDEDDPTYDDWGNPITTDGTPTTGLPCLYQSVRRLRTTEAGSVLVDVSTLTVPYDDPVAVGDRVTNVTDRDGTVLVAAASVESFDPNAEAGASVMKVCVLAGLSTVKG
jgi:hypothetical protein